MNSDEARWKSESLNVTISEIMDFLKDEGKRPAPAPGRLRNFLHEKIGDLGSKWYERGFRRGHRESYRHHFEEVKVPITIQYNCEREFFTGEIRAVTLKSKIPRSLLHSTVVKKSAGSKKHSSKQRKRPLLF